MKTITIIIFPFILITEFLLTTITLGMYAMYLNWLLNEELFTKQLLNYIRK